MHAQQLFHRYTLPYFVLQPLTPSALPDCLSSDLQPAWPAIRLPLVPHAEPCNLEAQQTDCLVASHLSPQHSLMTHSLGHQKHLLTTPTQPPFRAGTLTPLIIPTNQTTRTHVGQQQELHRILQSHSMSNHFCIGLIFLVLPHISHHFRVRTPHYTLI